jgi:hypothetical protein
MQLLLQLGADVSALSHAGWSALHVGMMHYCAQYSVQQYELPCIDATTAKQLEFFEALTALSAADVSCRTASSSAELVDVESPQPPSSHNGHFTEQMQQFLQGIVQRATTL